MKDVKYSDFQSFPFWDCTFFEQSSNVKIRVLPGAELPEIKTTEQ
jgi:hypothetical protein